MCLTRPVGSPPLKILDGSAWPNPWPWANTPASWPSAGAGLAALGLNYQLARTAASLFETAYMYAAVRWVVFRDAADGERQK